MSGGPEYCAEMNKEESSKQQEKRGSDGRFLPGESGNPSGRPEGAKNKFTNLKNAYLWVFDELGGQEGLLEWARENKRNRAMFYQWITKMLPSSVVGQQDDDGEFEPLKVFVSDNGSGKD